MSSQQGLPSHIDDDEDDESTGNDSHEEFRFNEHEDLLSQLPNRHRFSMLDTGKTTSAGWLKNWDVSMVIREFIQNAKDYIFKICRKPVAFERKANFAESVLAVLPDQVLKVVKSATRDDTLQCFETTLMHDNLPRASILTGRGLDSKGFFIVVQAATTLFAEHLWDMTSKKNDISQSGYHGCGLKEAALYLLWQKAKLKMWMPGASEEDEFPGDSWVFKLNEVNRMKVHGSKLKKFKARVLVILVTNIEPQWQFDPRKFLAFHQGPLDQIQVHVKKDCLVGDYSVLLDTNYAGKFFNYGIEVNSYSILEVLGIGINGTFKLTDRERKHVHDVRGRVYIILKYLFIRHPRIILERIGDKLAAIDLRKCVREEDPYKDKDIFECLRKAAREWKSDIPKDRVFLIDERWNDAQKNAITGFGYFLLPVKGFLGMDFITLLRMHLKTEWKDSPGSFQKVTTVTTLNGYEILSWAPNVANIPNVVILKSDNLKIVFVVGDPSMLEIYLQLARDDPETAAAIMSNRFQDDKSQGNKRARSKGNNNSEIITSAESPDKIQLCLANIAEIQHSMAKQAKQVKELEQQVRE
jgi:hypothetical protein